MVSELSSFDIYSSKFHYLSLHVVPQELAFVIKSSVMGKPMIYKSDDSYIQEYKYHTLTQNDVIALYKHESFQRMHLNLLLLNVILPKYPRGLDDCTSIPRLTLNPTPKPTPLHWYQRAKRISRP